ncbi:protein of unknown function [Microbacterium sp. Nx66]|nr:protein of unknown function [Microbacterium sp. Nx66]
MGHRPRHRPLIDPRTALAWGQYSPD